MRIVDKILLEKYRSMSCEVCGHNQGVHAHHLKTKQSGGDDVVNNLVAVCNSCHIKWHQYGTVRMAEENPHVEKILLDKGWKLDEFTNKWMRLRAEGWEHE